MTFSTLFKDLIS